MKLKHFIQRLVLTVVCGTLASSLHGNNLQEDSGDSIRLSLLTCSAGEEIYSLFGHTAIRYENYTRGLDVVFNYGLFNFSAPHFAFRFALGETDYMLGASNFQRFADDYREMHRDVFQQVLNLTKAEKEHLVSLLLENYRPENQVYRYNFFYDNCATRPRDRIEQSIDGTLVYPFDMNAGDGKGTTFRTLINHYSGKHLWSRFGMNYCIGAPADSVITRREMMYVPFYVRDYFHEAHIIDKQGVSRPLVSEEKLIITSTPLTPTPNIFDAVSPLEAALLLLLLVALLTAYGLWKRRTLWGIDLVLFLAAGLCGCLSAFLALFSQHPAMAPNYILCVFHPLHLIFLPVIIRKVRKHQRSLYLLLNLIVLTIFMLLWGFIPQEIEPAVLPLAACLWLRSVSNLILSRKK
jgi:hypothetical protein